jgi:hypothetical protein
VIALLADENFPLASVARTFDRDFGELIYRDLAPVPPGVVYLRVAASSPEEPAQVIADLPADTSLEILGRFSVVTADGVRQRALR